MCALKSLSLSFWDLEFFKAKKTLKGSVQEKNHFSAQYVKGTLLAKIQVEINKRTNMEEKPKCDLNFCLSNNCKNHKKTPVGNH